MKIYKELNYILATYAKRLISETSIFTELFSDLVVGIRSKYLIQSGNNFKGVNIENEIISLEKLPQSFKSPIDGFNSLIQSLEKLKAKSILTEKRNLSLSLIATQQILEELKISKLMAEECVKSIRAYA